MLEYYIIAAISFAIMYAYSYGYEIALSVMDLLYILDIDYRDSDWHPKIYIASSFIVSMLGMPFFLVMVLFQDKYETIKNAVAHIMKSSYGIEKEK